MTVAMKLNVLAIVFLGASLCCQIAALRIERRARRNYGVLQFPKTTPPTGIEFYSGPPRFHSDGKVLPGPISDYESRK